MFRFAAEQMLRELGFDVTAVGSGASAIEAYRELSGRVRMVLLDLQMPHMDGERTFFRLQELDPQVPVLLCSGFSAEPQAEKLQDAGALGFLHKPFEMASLGVHVDRALRRHRRRQRSTP